MTDWIEMLRKIWPKRWSNVRTDFRVEEMKLRFKCDDKNMGTIRVRVLDSKEEEIAHIEGGNSHNSTPVVAFNVQKFPIELLVECFQMARCRREFERTGNVEYGKGFDHFRARVIREWSLWKRV